MRQMKNTEKGLYSFTDAQQLKLLGRRLGMFFGKFWVGGHSGWKIFNKGVL